MFEIIAESHVDHGVPATLLEWAQEEMKRRGLTPGFHLLTMDIPADAADLKCELHGPLTGGAPVPESEVFYEIRGKRTCASRMVARPAVPTRKLTVICGPHGDKACVLYTAFGGPGGPREVGDPSIKSWEELLAARAFWAEHALSAPAGAPNLAEELKRAEAECARLNEELIKAQSAALR
jgi:hypothetical protein